MAQKNYYIILEVKSSATFDEIKSAYRVLAKKYHPDKNIGNKAAEEYFKEVQEAYGVLSNPEKRKKYDYKLSFGSRPQPQQKPSSNGPKYTGNAYQFAQQQAQYKQQQASAQQKKQPEKKEDSASWQILVSVGIALALLYFIISYSTEKTTPSGPGVQFYKDGIKKMEEINAQAEDAPEAFIISNYDSPYVAYFGDEVNDAESKNSILFLNASKSEAVICLVEKNTEHTIRNMYVNSESEIKMNQIPDGGYLVKIYFGNDWDPEKKILDGKIKGGFKTEKRFLKFHDEKDGILMKKDKKGSIDSYSTYEIKISPEDQQNAKTISAAAFFKKN